MASKAARCLRHRSTFLPPHPSNTLLPFLYQTATIWRRSISASSRMGSESTPLRVPGSVREARERSETEKVKRDGHPADDSTITRTERKAFQRLFNTAGKPGTPNQPIPKKDRNPDPMDDPEFALLERESWQSIFSSSSDDAIATEVAELMSNDMQERAPLIEKFPKALQTMAHRSQYKLLQEKRKEETERKIEEHVEEQRKKELGDKKLKARRDEVRRIGIEMLQAKTDTDVWQVLETKLFGPMRRLHEEEEKIQAHKQNRKMSKKARRKLKQKANKEDPDAQDPTATGIDVPTEPMTQQEMSLLAYMYHPLLTLAARLLCNRTKYTPLAIALLPTVKSLGYSSYALGASTQLYNCLIEYYWRVYADIGKIMALLREMESIGLKMDVNTDTILAQIVSHSQQASQGLLGGPLQALEGMNGRAAEIDQVKQWREAIRHSLEERKADQERAREFEKRMKQEEEEDALAEREQNSANEVKPKQRKSARMMV